MHQHDVEAGPARSRSCEGANTEAADAGARPVRMVPLAGLAVRRQPAGVAGQPAIRRTLVDNAGQAPVNVTTQQQLQTYQWWNSLSQPQQTYLVNQLPANVGPTDLQQALAAVPRRAVTGGMDLVNKESWELITQLVNQYSDVVCADPAMNLAVTSLLKRMKGWNITDVQQKIQDAAPAARNADIFIIHPGPWIYDFNTLHTDLRAVMTPGCVAYVLTDNETESGQAEKLRKGLEKLGGFTVTVQDLVPDPDGLVNLATGPRNGTLAVKPYHRAGYKLVRIAA